MQEFWYSQDIEYYKDNSLTSKKIKTLLEKLFGGNLIQNSPHSSDIPYPIETLWTELKKRVKERRVKNLDKLKLIMEQNTEIFHSKTF